MERCVVCGKVKAKKWAADISELIPRFIKWHPDALERKLVECVTERRKKATSLRVVLEGCIEELSFEAVHIVKANVKDTTCRSCSRRAGGYYEAIVQVRNVDDPQVLGGAVQKALKKADAFLVREQQVKHGSDLYIETIRGGKIVANALHRYFGGKFITSSKLVGRRDGRDVFRLTFLIRADR